MGILGSQDEGQAVPPGRQEERGESAPVLERAPEEKKAASSARSETLPRRFGDYLLTSRLGEDCLGRVYRALSFAEKGEFVRLRVLSSPELSREALREAARKREPEAPSRHRVRGERVGAVDGLPYIAWNEVHGWTLDALLSECRRVGTRLPLENTLLVANGITLALDGARPHGLVWPGFVSIEDDGQVRLAGSGLAAAILPSLDRPRLATSLAPYIAPEAREERVIGRNADVYSVAVIVLELLTGWRTPFPGLGKGLGAGEEFPHELGRLLQVSLAKSRSRLPSVGDFRRELGKLMVSENYRPSSFDFSRYLTNISRGEKARRNRALAAETGGEPDHLAFPVLDEVEIDTVLQKFWGRIEG